MFVSANAVVHFFAAAPPGRGWPAGVLAGSTGPGTSAALRSAGVPVPLLVEPAADAPKFDSEALWERLASRQWAGLSVLVVRGEDGRDWLAETLRERGAAVDFLAAYRRGRPHSAIAEQALLQQSLADPAGHLWLFSSSEAVEPPARPGAGSRLDTQRRAGHASAHRAGCRGGGIRSRRSRWHLVQPRWLRPPPRGRARSRR